MEGYYRRNYIPAFGSWNWNEDLPFTQCFELSEQPGFLRRNHSVDRDFYVAGDLYKNDVVTPAMIVVPRSTTRRGRVEEEGRKEGWIGNVKKPPSPIDASLPRTAPKPVDEDLYKISPTLLHTKPIKKGGLRFLRSLASNLLCLNKLKKS